MSPKATLSIEWLSGCSGCEVAFADLHEDLPAVLKDEVELVRIPILMDTKDYVPADVGMITGSIRTEHDVTAARRMRECCKTIVALGTCPVYGGPHGGSYAHSTQELLEEAFVRNPTTRTSTLPTQVPKLLEEDRTLDSEIEVDLYIPGCPPHPAFIIEGLRSLLQGREPKIGRHNVCFRCQRAMEKTDVGHIRREYQAKADPELCFLSQGHLCFGSVTLDRCLAPCPQVGAPCFSCSGPSIPVILEPQKDVRTMVATTMAHLTKIPEEDIIREIERQAKTHYAYAMASKIFRHKPTFRLREWIKAAGDAG
ncbi:MAG: F420-non-reducing hydrogenase small subunit [Candidatus Kentron sp. G]|nr:MAG: F420-non-reducing hydrogenase small subunit [Candidatus Kentron sp. G]VFM95733.1 MAG: F420-non-reducing hydrogenase small subunit [Candidatus Kentron sp. G]VFM97511.1 MAG: F420-non-reducing hydrogenase small subunit [Candidatus Kentron sp. G]